MKRNLLAVCAGSRPALLKCKAIIPVPQAPAFFAMISMIVLFMMSLVANKAQAQEWQLLASEQDIASAASNYTSVATTTDGAATITYVIYTESGIAKVKKFD